MNIDISKLPSFPEILAEQLISVQPMSTISGEIFNIRYVPPVWYKRFRRWLYDFIWNVEPCCVCEGCVCFGMGHRFETCWKHRHVVMETLRKEQTKYREKI